MLCSLAGSRTFLSLATTPVAEKIFVDHPKLIWSIQRGVTNSALNSVQQTLADAAGLLTWLAAVERSVWSITFSFSFRSVSTSTKILPMATGTLPSSLPVDKHQINNTQSSSTSFFRLNIKVPLRFHSASSHSPLTTIISV